MLEESYLQEIVMLARHKDTGHKDTKTQGRKGTRIPGHKDTGHKDTRTQGYKDTRTPSHKVKLL